jgi:hypothetical protein
VRSVVALRLAGAPPALGQEGSSWTPLHSGTLLVHTDPPAAVAVVDALLAGKADVNAPDKNDVTPLCALFRSLVDQDAASTAWMRSGTADPPPGVLAILRALCKRGANCAHPDAGGNFPLGIWAREMPLRLDVLELLLAAAPADCHTRDKDGRNALHLLVASAARVDDAQLLEPAGRLTRALTELLPRFQDGFVHELDRESKIAWDLCSAEVRDKGHEQPADSFWGLLHAAFRYLDVCHCKGGKGGKRGCTTSNCLCFLHGKACGDPAAAGDAADAAPAHDLGCPCKACKNPFGERAHRREAVLAAVPDAPAYFVRLRGAKSLGESLHVAAGGVSVQDPENIPEPWRSGIGYGPYHDLADVSLSDLLELKPWTQLSLRKLLHHLLAFYTLVAARYHLAGDVETPEGVRGLVLGFYDPYGLVKQTWRARCCAPSPARTRHPRRSCTARLRTPTGGSSRRIATWRTSSGAWRSCARWATWCRSALWRLPLRKRSATKRSQTAWRPFGWKATAASMATTWSGCAPTPR